MTSRLVNGTRISYSAGTTNLDPNRFRCIAENEDIIREVLELDQKLRSIVADDKSPILINAYPSDLGIQNFPHGIFVETFCNVDTCLRALQLAALEDRNAIVVGQPIFIAEVFWKAELLGLAMPGQIVVIGGGYYFPLSLEQYIQNSHSKSNFYFVSFYGVAEIQSGLLFSNRRTDSGHQLFVPRSPRISIVEVGAGFAFVLKDKSGQESIYPCEDKFEFRSDGILLANRNNLSVSTQQSLESWNGDCWARRTGRRLVTEMGEYWQLRENMETPSSDELPFYTFFERSKQSHFHKPHWSEVS